MSPHSLIYPILGMYRYKYKLMKQIRMCKDLKHVIYYRSVFQAISSLKLWELKWKLCIVGILKDIFNRYLSMHFDKKLENAGSILDPLARGLAVASGRRDGVCGCSSCVESPPCWRDGWATCCPDSLRAGTARVSCFCFWGSVLHAWNHLPAREMVGQLAV